MQTLNEDCRCIFFHPRNPARRAELQAIIDNHKPGKPREAYQIILAHRMLGPCETRGE